MSMTPSESFSDSPSTEYGKSPSGASYGFARIPPTDLAWAAGIVDGEGYVSIDTTFVLRLSVSNTDPRITDRLLHLFGGSKHQYQPRQNQTSLCHYWVCQLWRAVSVLE